jgi:hypothetical protein
VAIDCVVNRTLIPKLTNIKVSNKPPSKYLGEIKAKNPKISEALQSHMPLRGPPAAGSSPPASET